MKSDPDWAPLDTAASLFGSACETPAPSTRAERSACSRTAPEGATIVSCASGLAGPPLCRGRSPLFTRPLSVASRSEACRDLGAADAHEAVEVRAAHPDVLDDAADRLVREKLGVRAALRDAVRDARHVDAGR